MTSWTVIAETGALFAEFGPFVASIDDDGLVAFQASLVDGGTGVFTGRGAEVAQIVLSPPVSTVTSHPDVNGAGAISFYGALANGEQGVFFVARGVLTSIALTSSGFASIGPAGPTMNAAGAVAFRADRSPGVSGIFLWDGESVSTIAETGQRWHAVQGLPVVEDDGAVVFRADRDGGVEGIYRAHRDSVVAIVETDGRFETIARFPSVAADGTVAFAATVPGGGGVFTARDGLIEAVQTDGAFASYRGALISDAGTVRIATPRGGTLGLFTGADPELDRILAEGDALFGSIVEEFAANPVSVNVEGQLALRVTLHDGRGCILRCEPFGAPAPD